MFVSIAAACGLFVLAEPIIRLLFGRGHFLKADIEQTALILKTYCWIMVFSSGVRVLTPAYNAIKNTWFPAIVSGCCLLVHIFLAPQLMTIWQVQGLMISTITSAALNLTLLLSFYHVLIYDFEYLTFLKNIFKYAIVGLIIACIGQSYFIFQKLVPNLMAIIMTIMCAAGIFFVIALRLFPVEFRRLSSRFFKR
jgi:putative peptidoglycan lipid II flippase